ncbi:hypothetical protein BGX27_002023 [Mortierella sp. AM989]|nr:hypothetical protein BGX27_002023 [Mortierella sp. AM989]
MVKHNDCHNRDYYDSTIATNDIKNALYTYILQIGAPAIQKESREHTIINPPKRTKANEEEVIKQVIVEKEFEEVKECPCADPSMWFKVGVGEGGEYVFSEEESKELEDCSLASASMGIADKKSSGKQGKVT